MSVESSVAKAGKTAIEAGGKVLKSPAGKLLGKAMLVGSVVDTAKDLKKGKYATAATDAAFLIPGVGTAAGIGLAGLQATGVTDKLDKKISKTLKSGSEASSKFAGSHKMEEKGREMASKGEDKFNIAKSLMDGYKSLGKGGAGTAIAIGAALVAALSGAVGDGTSKQNSMFKQVEGPSLG